MDVPYFPHKYPGVDGTFPIDDVLAEPLNKQGLVLVIFDDLVKSRNSIDFVIPAKAGIPYG